MFNQFPVPFRNRYITSIKRYFSPMKQVSASTRASDPQASPYGTKDTEKSILIGFRRESCREAELAAFLLALSGQLTVDENPLP